MSALVSGLRTRLLALVFLAVLPFLLLTLHATWEQRRLAREAALTDGLRLARLAASEKTNRFEGARHLLMALAHLPAVQADDPQNCNALLGDLLPTFASYANLGVINRDGRLFCSALPFDPQLDLTDRGYFQEALNQGQFSAGVYQVGRVTGQPSVNFGYPVTDSQGKIFRVVYVAMTLDWLTELVETMDLPPGATLNVLDAQGTVLARYPGGAEWVGRQVPEAPVLTQLQQAGEGTAELPGLDGVLRLTAFTRFHTVAGDGNIYVVVGIPSQVAFAAANQALLRNLTALLLVLVLALGTSWVASDRLILHRVQLLLTATRRIAAGDLAARADLPDDGGEISQLGKAFNDMAASLEQRIAEREETQQELERERALLARRVEERTADLSLANAELARAARLKDEFLASMSHELRTPLNAVLGLSEALQEEVYGPLNSDQQQTLKDIEASGRHLLALINDILDVSKVEAGKMELEPATVSVELVCHASLQLVKETAHKKRLKLTTAIDPAVEFMAADERRLKQILVNLLSNAVKFTPEGGAVGLEVKGDAAHNVVHFTVWDTGIGIPAEYMERLFEPFVQLDSRLSRQYAGTGLGLTLVYRMVEMHGGSLAVESEVGQGSRFTITLPWQAASDVEVTGPPDQAEDGAASGRLQRALLIEDSPSAVFQTSRYLAELGAETVVHREGQGAVQQAVELQPDLIILDILLPDFSGWEILTWLKNHPQTASIPVLIVSVVDDRPYGLELGAAEYLVKPISRDQLQAAVQALLPESDTQQLRALIFAGESSKMPETGSEQPPVGRQPLILLAEDNELNIKTIYDFLLAKRYRAVVARNGREAVLMAEEMRPDLILMDVQMPQMDGLEAMQLIRTNPATAAVPIIALTALAMPGDKERCLAAGANRYMTKPARLLELEATISRLLPPLEFK
jgi:signal transduction histidine kinase/CheY-like chemotaxis protein